MKRWAVLIACLAATGSPAWAAEAGKAESEAAYEPTSSYQATEIEGFPVRISARLVAESEICRRVKEKIAYDLMQVRRVLPGAAVERLQSWPIWLELKTKGAAQFHVSRDWLLGNGFNPEKVGNVEVSDANYYLGEPEYRRANVLLHELAHAYHYHVLGYDNAEVIRVYDRAKQSGRYEKVLHDGGREIKHYALTNPYEYFAEMSESLFWVNDFHPFVRAELQREDPEAAELLLRLWREPPTRKLSSDAREEAAEPATREAPSANDEKE